MNTLIFQRPEDSASILVSNPNLLGKPYNSGLRALLSIRDSGLIMERHRAQMLRIQKKVEALNLSTLASIKNHCSPESFEKIEFAFSEITDSVASITELLNLVKEKIVNKDRRDTTELWSRFDLQLDHLQASFMHVEDFGRSILNGSEHLFWKEEMDKYRSSLLPTIFSYARSCRVELQIIERYTIEELKMITQIIFEKIPQDFNVEEAEEYERDYLNALKDFRKEFSAEKNLWDKFLDILSGGTHQSPAEHVMMERWIEGEKGDLQ